MRKSYLKKFKKISFSEMVRINTKINSNELAEIVADEEKLKSIKPNMLKSEYIQEIQGNEVIISNSKDTYSIKFYNKLTIITEVLNNNTQLGKRTVSYYVDYK